MVLEEGGEVMLSPLAHFGSEADAQPANTQRQAHIPQVYESTFWPPANRKGLVGPGNCFVG